MRTTRILVLMTLIGCGGGGGHESPTSPTPPVVQTASLSGTVTTLGTSSPVAGAVATAGGFSSTTGTDGKYALTGLATGQVTLSVTRSGYDLFTKTVTLSAGSNSQDVQLSQSTTGTSVTGNVSGLFPIDGQVHALAGVQVAIAGKTDQTDAAGNFQLPTIPEGNQVVTLKLAGWQDFSQAFFISSTNRNLTLRMQYGLPVLTAQNLPGQVFVCDCFGSSDTAFISASMGTLTGAASQYAYTVTATGWRLAPMVSSTQECTSCTRMSSSGQQNGAPGTCATASRECCPANGQIICPLPSPTATGGPGTLYQVGAGAQTAAPRALMTPYGVDEQNCGPFVNTVTSARLTITGIHVAATNDVNQWTHYDVGNAIFDQPWRSSNTSCP